jgi:hypothetical protein
LRVEGLGFMVEGLVNMHNQDIGVLASVKACAWLQVEGLGFSVFAQSRRIKNITSVVLRACARVEGIVLETIHWHVRECALDLILLADPRIIISSVFRKAVRWNLDVGHECVPTLQDKLR